MGRSRRNTKRGSFHSKFNPSGISSSVMDLENSSLIIDEFIAIPIYDNYNFSAGYDSSENLDVNQAPSNTKPKYIRVYMNSGVMIKSGICAGTPVLVEYGENNDSDENITEATPVDDTQNDKLLSPSVKRRQVYIHIIIIYIVIKF